MGSGRARDGGCGGRRPFIYAAGEGRGCARCGGGGGRVACGLRVLHVTDDVASQRLCSLFHPGKKKPISTTRCVRVCVMPSIRLSCFLLSVPVGGALWIAGRGPASAPSNLRCFAARGRFSYATPRSVTRGGGSSSFFFVGKNVDRKRERERERERIRSKPIQTNQEGRPLRRRSGRWRRMSCVIDTFFFFFFHQSNERLAPNVRNEGGEASGTCDTEE
jgi:hypothetical protein